MQKNRFKARLKSAHCQTGFWLSTASANVAEISAGAGFDFIVIDAEHSPNTVPTVLEQMRAVAPYEVDVLVRPRSLDAGELKQYLDIGSQNILIPFVETPEQAEEAVVACFYPPRGKRGVSMAHRSNSFGRNPAYFERAGRELCIIPQIETQLAMENLEKIASVDGVSALFVGPADLAADLGHVGQPNHPDLLDAIRDIAKRCANIGMPFGTLVPNAEQAADRRALGASFVAAGTDSGVIRSETDKLVGTLGMWKDQP